MHNWQAEGKTRMKAQLARANMLLTDTTMRTKTLLLARMHETQAFAGRTMALLKAKTRTLLVCLCLSLSLRAYQCIHPYSCLLASAALNVCVGAGAGADTSGTGFPPPGEAEPAGGFAARAGCRPPRRQHLHLPPHHLHGITLRTDAATHPRALARSLASNTR